MGPCSEQHDPQHTAFSYFLSASCSIILPMLTTSGSLHFGQLEMSYLDHASVVLKPHAYSDYSHLYLRTIRICFLYM
jgi:hypothetical protein